MDPLILIVNELQQASDEIARYEHALSVYEAQSHTYANDLRYQRLVVEKMEVIKSVARMRTELTERAVTTISAQGMAIYAMKKANGTAYFLDKATLLATPIEPIAEEIDIDDKPEATRLLCVGSPPYSGVRPVVSPSPAMPFSSLTQALPLGTAHTPPLVRAPVLPPHEPPLTAAAMPAPYQEYLSPFTPAQGPEDLVDVGKYAAAKAQLASIMRDHSAQKIHFVGLDDHLIAVPEYQLIRRYVKAGQDPALHMKGEYRSYFVGYVKKTNEFVQNKLFFPEFHFY